jgi:hypothetical protein
MKVLGTIFFSLIAILASLVFLLSSLCASATHGDDRQIFILVALGALLFVIASMRKIAILNRKPRRAPEPDPLLPPYSIAPPSSAPPPPPRPAAMQSRSIPSSEVPRASQPSVSPPNTPSAASQSRAIRDVVGHLSPASQAAIQQLAFALAAKIAAEVVLGLIGWYSVLGSTHAPFALFKFGFLAWGLAAILPDLVLLYGLTRRPGSTAFAYALVIPALHLLFGISGHSALLVLLPRSSQAAIPLLSIIPWILDVLIPYLAWKTIRSTGIRPDPTRLITAFVVILIYRILLPALFVFLN